MADFMLNLLTYLHFNYTRPKFDVNLNYYVGNIEVSEICTQCNIVCKQINKTNSRS